MPEAPLLDVDPFAPWERGIDEPDPHRATMRAAGPLVRLHAPAGGPVWVATDDAVARRVLRDPGLPLSKDPAWAPIGWDPRAAELEPTAAEQPSLTTLEGAEHAAWRHAHTPALSTHRLAASAPRVDAVVRARLVALPTDEPVDLVADLAARLPAAVLLDLLGAPDRHDDLAVAAARGMFADDPAAVGAAMGRFAALADAAVDGDPDGLAAALRDRMPPGTTPGDLRYALFTLLFAGQLTTEAALGFLLARALDERPAVDPTGAWDDAVDAFVRDTLRCRPPAPFTLWRFTTAPTEIAGHPLPARAPVLVDVLGIGTAPDRPAGPDLVFGAGTHHCTGARLALLELATIVRAVRTTFPDARLAVPRPTLRQVHRGGIGGPRLTALPVVLGPAVEPVGDAR